MPLDSESGYQQHLKRRQTGAGENLGRRKVWLPAPTRGVGVHRPATIRARGAGELEAAAPPARRRGLTVAAERGLVLGATQTKHNKHNRNRSR